MSYERYKDFRLAPDINGCWDVLDKEYQHKHTFPSKAAAKRWIDKELDECDHLLPYVPVGLEIDYGTPLMFKYICRTCGSEAIYQKSAQPKETLND